MPQNDLTARLCPSGKCADGAQLDSRHGRRVRTAMTTRLAVKVCSNYREGWQLFNLVV